MADKHLLIVGKKPTNEEFMSNTWKNRLDYVGLVKKDGGGGRILKRYSTTSLAR